MTRAFESSNRLSRSLGNLEPVPPLLAKIHSPTTVDLNFVFHGRVSHALQIEWSQCRSFRSGHDHRLEQVGLTRRGESHDSKDALFGFADKERSCLLAIKKFSGYFWWNVTSQYVVVILIWIANLIQHRVVRRTAGEIVTEQSKHQQVRRLADRRLAPAVPEPRDGDAKIISALDGFQFPLVISHRGALHRSQHCDMDAVVGRVAGHLPPDLAAFAEANRNCTPAMNPVGILLLGKQVRFDVGPVPVVAPGAAKRFPRSTLTSGNDVAERQLRCFAHTILTRETLSAERTIEVFALGQVRMSRLRHEKVEEAEAFFRIVRGHR